MWSLKRLMPQEDKFNALFERHAVEIHGAARALREAMSGTPGGFDEVVRREDAADAVTRDVLLAARRSFITPFDRGAIKDLVTAMDDAIDAMNKTVSTVRLFGVAAFTDEMRGMAERIVAASALIDQAIPLMREMGANANALIDLCGRVVVIEGEADEIHQAGIKRLWDERGGIKTEPGMPVPDAGDLAMKGLLGLERFLVNERLLDSLEKVMDRLEDTADMIHGVVIEHV